MRRTGAKDGLRLRRRCEVRIPPPGRPRFRTQEGSPRLETGFPSRAVDEDWKMQPWWRLTRRTRVPRRRRSWPDWRQRHEGRVRAALRRHRIDCKSGPPTRSTCRKRGKQGPSPWPSHRAPCIGACQFGEWPNSRGPITQPGQHRRSIPSLDPQASTANRAALRSASVPRFASS